MKLRGEHDARAPVRVSRQSRGALGRIFAQESKLSPSQTLEQLFAILVVIDGHAVNVWLSFVPVVAEALKSDASSLRIKVIQLERACAHRVLLEARASVRLDLLARETVLRLLA